MGSIIAQTDVDAAPLTRTDLGGVGAVMEIWLECKSNVDLVAAMLLLRTR
jgi:hypothetical protein